MSDQTERLYATTDALTWAEEFIAVVESGATVDAGLMVGWFANAMATAESHTLRDHPERKAVEDQDFVVLPREALFEFFGEVALPPWNDEHGRLIGRDVDCAPLAERITDWVKAHDLGDLYRAPDARAGQPPGDDLAAAAVEELRAIAGPEHWRHDPAYGHVRGSLIRRHAAVLLDHVAVLEAVSDACGEALMRFRLALTALDLAELEQVPPAECKAILAAACQWLVDLGARDPMEPDNDTSSAAGSPS